MERGRRSAPLRSAPLHSFLLSPLPSPLVSCLPSPVSTARHGSNTVRQVFSTNITKDRETSFDHPNLPAIVNPFNTHNKMAYNPGAHYGVRK